MEFRYRIDFSSSSQEESALPLLYVARMMVIFLVWVRGMDNILPPFLPFIEGLNLLRGQLWLFSLLDWLYWIALVMVFVGIRYRFFSLILGVLVFFSIISSKPLFSNSFLYSGCILFLIGMYRPGMDWIFRVQIALLYLGAGLNKLLDPDWLSGQYFDFFFSEPYRNDLYLKLSSLIPGRGLAVFFSYATIFAELSFGIWALLQKRRILLVLFINFFHISMLLLTAGELSYIFFFLMAVSSYLLLPWEEMKGATVAYNQNSRLFSFFRQADFDRYFHWNSFDKQLFAFEIQKNSLYFMIQSILFNKFLFGVLILTVVFLCRYKFHLSALF
jgi:hypothetical protein